MIPILITFGFIGLIILIHYIMYKRNNPIPTKLEYEPLRTYKRDPAYTDYESNESDVQQRN
jgi:hypothetical protein